MKKTLLLLLLLIVVGVGAYMAVTTNKVEKTTLNSTGVKFTWPKDDIGRVYIDRKNATNYDFVKTDKGWMFNGKHKANMFAFSHVLTTLSKMDMKFIPYKESRDNIINEMKNSGIHVTVYDNAGKAQRAFTIGSNAKKGDATYMLIDGDNQPYAMTLKSFDGSLRERFNYPRDNWINKMMFDEEPSEISTVKMIYPKHKSSSFVLSKKEGKFTVEPGDKLAKPINRPINEAKLVAYLNSFKMIGAEGIDNKNPKKDSIMNLVPFLEIHMIKIDGEELKFSFMPFRDILNPKVNTIDLKELESIERYFVTNEITGDFMVIQQRVFKDLLRSYDYFYN